METSKHPSEIKIDQLVSFKGHPFEPYKGKRFADMVESIRSNGIHQPIIVRPLYEGTYEILFGHNRVRAAIEQYFSKK